MLDVSSKRLLHCESVPVSIPSPSVSDGCFFIKSVPPLWSCSGDTDLNYLSVMNVYRNTGKKRWREGSETACDVS